MSEYNQYDVLVCNKDCDQFKYKKEITTLLFLLKKEEDFTR